jgi:hypothetical protein
MLKTRNTLIAAAVLALGASAWAQGDKMEKKDHDTHATATTQKQHIAKKTDHAMKPTTHQPAAKAGDKALKPAQ